MEEFEFDTQKPALQAMRLMLASAGGPYRGAARGARARAASTAGNSSGAGTSGTGGGGAMHKYGGSAVYERLWAPEMPCRMDPVQATLALCATLRRLYEKLHALFRRSFGGDGSRGAPGTAPAAQGGPGWDSTAALQALLKLDQKLSSVVLGPLAKDLTAIALAKAQHELAVLADRAAEHAPLC
eukprot:g7616.t1